MWDLLWYTTHLKRKIKVSIKSKLMQRLQEKKKHQYPKKILIQFQIQQAAGRDLATKTSL